MSDGEIQQMIEARVSPVEQALREFMESEKASREAMANVLTRLSLVTVGDKEYGQAGLTGRVAALEDFKTSQQALMNKGEGATRASIWIIGGLFTLLNVLLKYL